MEDSVGHGQLTIYVWAGCIQLVSLGVYTASG